MALRLAVDREVAQAGDDHRQPMLGDVEFRVDVTHEPGGVRVTPVGDVDLATSGRLRARIDEAMAASADRLILDLRATTFLDSSGLHVVVDTDTRATSSGTEFVIVAVPPGVQRTFDVAGLSGCLPCVDGTQPPSSATGFDRVRIAPRHGPSGRPRV